MDQKSANLLPRPAPEASGAAWYYIENANAIGPVDRATVSQMIGLGRIGELDYVWERSLGQEWKLLKDVPEFEGELAEYSDAGFECPSCRVALRQKPDEKPGDEVTCPSCDARIIVPAVPNDAGPPAI